MSETKDEIAAERDRLREENDRLRAHLAAAGRTAAPPAEHQFVLSEGQRQDLLTTGVTTVGGVRKTADEVRELLGDAQQGVDLGDTDPVDAAVATRPNLGIPGVDFIYPSVVPGAIDPAVAGTPGINGPAATEEQMAHAREMAHAAREQARA